MADLPQALDAALRARYRPREVRTPVTQRRGLMARISQLEKLHARPGDKPGRAAARAAEAAGIPVRTWRGWKHGEHKPSAANARKLEGAYARQITTPALKRAVKPKARGGEGIPSQVTVTARIRWTDSPRKMYNTTPDRTVKFTDMRAVMVSVVRAWVGAGPAAAAEAFERRTSELHKVAPDSDGGPGIRFEPTDQNQVTIEFED